MRVILVLLIYFLISNNLFGQEISGGEIDELITEKLKEYISIMVHLDEERKSFNKFFVNDASIVADVYNREGLYDVSLKPAYYFYHSNFSLIEGQAKFKKYKFSYDSVDFFRGQYIPVSFSNLEQLFKFDNFKESDYDKVRKLVDEKTNDKYNYYFLETAIRYQNFLGDHVLNETIAKENETVFIIWMFRTKNSGKKIKKNSIGALLLFTNKKRKVPSHYLGKHSLEDDDVEIPFTFSAGQVKETRNRSKKLIQEYYTALSLLPHNPKIAEETSDMFLRDKSIDLVDDFLTKVDRSGVVLNFKREANLTSEDKRYLTTHRDYLSNLAGVDSMLISIDPDKFRIKTGIESTRKKGLYFHVCKVPVSYSIYHPYYTIEVEGGLKFVIIFNHSEEGGFSNYRISNIRPDSLSIIRIPKQGVHIPSPIVEEYKEVKSIAEDEAISMLKRLLASFKKIAAGRKYSVEERRALKSMFEDQGRNTTVAVHESQNTDLIADDFIRLDEYLSKLSQVKRIEAQVLAENIGIAKLRDGYWIAEIPYLQYTEMDDGQETCIERLIRVVFTRDFAAYKAQLSDIWIRTEGIQPIVDCDGLLSPRP